APVYAVSLAELDGGGTPEIIMGGNLYDVKPQAGPYDASRGVVLGWKEEGVVSYPPHLSGLNVSGQIRGIRTIRTPQGTALVVARFDEEPVLLKVN
ncbi:MAG: hypothetical protein JJU46_00450, partial [Balneolaceae bacterium]|nr:hypothetical protein [Balneolaceae bacterium]